jgi:hypothetical protein
MTGPEGELPKDGSGAFEDAVVLELCDLRSGAGALLRLARTDRGARAAARAVVCSAGEVVALLEESELEPGIESWESASAASIAIETITPQSAWRARMDTDRIVLDVAFEAVSAPIDFEEGAAAPIGLAGIHRHEQLCRVRGELRVDGASTSIDGVGRRARAWGDPAGARIRSLYAVGEARAVTVAAVLPAGGDGHGAEHIAAFLVTPDTPPEAFDDVRLSTVYDGAGRPRTAGIELFMAGDEYPRRVSGEAVCASQAARGGAAACFRWSLEGEPAAGGYQIGHLA